MRNYIIHKDSSRRQTVKKYELSRKVLKSISVNQNLSFEFRSNAFLKLLKLAKNSSSTRIRNRCILTGRGRGVLSFFKLSRNVFRTLASNGYIPGVRKSSW